MARKPYPTDVTDEEWAFVAPYLTLMREDAPQREHSLREVFDALRYVVRAGEAWRMMPNDLPPWDIVYQQTRRWIKAGVFEAMTHDLRELLRMLVGGDLRQSHAAEHPRKRRAWRLRRSQAQERKQDARGGGHAGTSAGVACHIGRSAGSIPRQATGQRRAGSHR